MRKYRVAWLPGDGVGKEVCDAARLVLDAAGFEADYLDGDIGWEFWRQEGEALPERTVELLRSTDCAFFGAITSKPAPEAERELAPHVLDMLRGLPGPRIPIVRCPRATYDVIVSGLPLNNFAVDEVRRILDGLAKLAQPGGTLSFFEYIAMRRMKAIVSGPAERRRLSGIRRAMHDEFKIHEIRRDAVWRNIPPAWVHHVRV